MKYGKWEAAVRVLAAFLMALLLAGCARAPSSDEIEVGRRAPKPSSPDAAATAIKSYFDGVLFDGPSARWRFGHPPVNGYIAASPLIGGSSEVGWFECGEVNAKNRMGGYVGWEPFLAFFSPAAPDLVIDGSVDDETSDLHMVQNWCDKLYGSS